MNEVKNVINVAPTDGWAKLMRLLNEDLFHYDKVIARNDGNGRLVNGNALVGDADPKLSFSPAACGLLPSSEEKLLL